MSLSPPVPRPSAPESHVRDGGVDDLDAVMTVMDSAFPREFGEAWTRSQCAGIMPMAGVVLRLADDAAAAPGVRAFSLSRILSDEAELLLIAVASDAQRCGLGRQLVDDFVMLAGHGGARHLHLEVREGNPAIALYHSAGFAIAGRRRDYYRGLGGQSCDALTLVKRL